MRIITKFKEIINEDHHKIQRGHINKRVGCAERAFDRTIIIREQITTKQEIIKTSYLSTST